MAAWKPVLSNSINFGVMLKTLPTKGKMAWEYNPLRNYRLSSPEFEYQGSYYNVYDLYKKFHILISTTLFVKNSAGARYYSATQINGYEPVSSIENELIYCFEQNHEVSKNSFNEALSNGGKYEFTGVPSDVTNPILHEKGELVDFITDELNFSINHPVQITPQPSYDGSVNLILNDGINIPRLINTRFSTTGKDTYEIVDRKGDNDTNIYDQGEQFDIDTSLYKRTTKIPKLEFSGVQAGGNLKIGNYHFYFKFADADGNETDFVAESGLVSVFKGYDIPSAISTGMQDENSVKAVRFFMTNIDASYNYVHVYYSRSTAQGQSRMNTQALTQYCRIDKNFTVNNANQCNILITGFENTVDVSAADINLQYNVASAVETTASCQNMLMMGNIHRPEIPYEELADLSLRFLPYVKEVTYGVDMNENYVISSNNKGYYDPKFIYNKVGYWNREFYRLGIVYILPNNELSPVFNIRGRANVKPFNKDSKFLSEGDNPLYKNGQLFNDGQYNHYKVYQTKDGVVQRVKININEKTFYTLAPEQTNTNDEGISATDGSYYENAKGVISLAPEYDTDKIYALDIRVDDDTVQELKKYVKGYFFVRQERIPTTLCQGITIGIDNVAHTPTIPTQGGFLTEMADNLDGSTYVQVDDINDVNYISEGFLSRYSFTLKPKGTGFWSKLGKVVLGVAVVAVVAAATVVTAGTAAVGAGLVAAATVTSAATTTAIVGGIAIAGVAATGAITGGLIEGGVAVGRTLAKKKLEGRNTHIPSNYKRSENEQSRQISEDFRDRIIIKDPTKNSVSALICPEYEVNQAFYNQIFTGNEHTLITAKSQSTNRLKEYSSDFFSNNENHFFIPSYYDTDKQSEYTVRIQGVPDDSPMVGIDENTFRSRAGNAEEAFRYEQVGEEYKDDDKKINSDIIRGSFGPYVAMVGYPQRPCDTVNIMIPGYSDSNTEEYISIRMDDNSSFFAISDRFAMSDIDENLINPLARIKGAEDRTGGYSWELYRGDCYICQVTHRINRNFNDPSAPYNDKIVDKETWKENYDPDEADKLNDINLGDVNAVRLGMWVTFKIRSTYNLNIRSVDDSFTDEKLMCGHGRGYYPVLPMSTEGCFKTPETEIQNTGFKKSVSERYNFAVPDVPYIKNWFGTRILYSDIHINDAYKNGFRVFKGTSFIDCPRTYGEITKLVEYKGDLIVVFEHGIGLIKVDPTAVAKNLQAGHEQIAPYKVLSQPVMLSDVIGSQWKDSIIKTPGNFGDGINFVYGVDTVAKRIWRCNGTSVETISDMRVQEFLNNNITLGERENTPVIGIRNVKTFYNSFKRDVLFTFYDNLQGFEEKVWNLCWNELQQMFVTFYSWVPSVMENINNIPFSFNRNTEKWIAKLGISHADNSFADGITLTNNIVENNWTNVTEGTDALTIKVKVLNSRGKFVEKELKPGSAASDTEWQLNSGARTGLIGILGVTGINLPEGKNIIYKANFSLQRDNFQNYKLFEIKEAGYYKIGNTLVPVYGLYFSPETTTVTTREYQTDDDGNYILDSKGQKILKTLTKSTYTVSAINLQSELYYRNKAKHAYADWVENRLKVQKGNQYYTTLKLVGSSQQMTVNGKVQYYDLIEQTLGGTNSNIQEIIEQNLPIFKDRYGKRQMLDRDAGEMINPEHIVRLLNIRAEIYAKNLSTDNETLDEHFYNYAKQNSNTPSEIAKDSSGWISCGYYESVVAVITRWNMQFLSTDFWKHGQAGLMDIADKIYPAYWFGEQHPFEFEFVVADNPSMHKIFTNLQIVSNKAKPDSFHFEVMGDAYDFAPDKKNMYFRQEAMKDFYQYNGADIIYNRNFLETQPEQNKVSADFPHKYYARQDTFNEIYDSYKQCVGLVNKDYDHLTGSEIVYYPTRNEYAVWTHQKAVSVDDFDGYKQDDDGWEGARALIASNCKYLEDRWHVVINPIVVCYKNEYNPINNIAGNAASLVPSNSTWLKHTDSTGTDIGKFPKLPVLNSPLPYDDNNVPLFTNNPSVTNNNIPKDLQAIGYTIDDFDADSWLDDVDIHGYSWGGTGTNANREEVPIRDKFVKVRIRYTGKDLALIDFINTIYQLSYA